MCLNWRLATVAEVNAHMSKLEKQILAENSRYKQPLYGVDSSTPLNEYQEEEIMLEAHKEGRT